MEPTVKNLRSQTLKILILSALIFLCGGGIAGADSALTYPLNGSPAATDQLLGIDDPSGSWAINRFAIQALFDLMEADISGFSIHAANIAAGGITDDAILQVDGSPNDDEYARFTANGIEGRTVAEVRADIDVTADTVSILSISDDTWIGKTNNAAVAGEALDSGDQWTPVYTKWSVDGPRIFQYKAGQAYSDNDTYKPHALLVSSGTYAAGDTITITVGNGIFSNNNESLVYGTDEGKPYYIGTSGWFTKTAPATSGDHIIRIATILSVEGGSYNDVFYVDFGFVDLTVP